MAQSFEYFHFLKEIFPKAGPELLRLLQGAAENAGLLRSDFYTIRDWLEIAGYRDQEAAHAIVLLMLTALEEGSLCIEIDETSLLQRLRDFVAEPDATAWSRQIVGAPAMPNLIGTSACDHKPVIACAVGTRRFLYFQKYLRAELDFQKDLTDRLGRGSESARADWEKIAQEVMKEQPLQLDGDQQRALGTALVNNFAIISGGPGTGKTSIVLTLLRCLVRGGYTVDRIALAAPTGRAAQRLSDSLRAGLERLPAPTETDASLHTLAATTLHTLLGFRPKQNAFSRHCENPIPAEVVIVDEVSMVGLVLMASLLRALAPKAKLILLGDKDQLPSVDAGAVLAHLVPLAEPAAQAGSPFVVAAGATVSLQDRVVLLQTNHRSEQKIREAAHAINGQDISVVDRLPNLKFPHLATAAERWSQLEKDGGCWLLEQSLATANELRAFLQQWAEQAYFRSQFEGATFAERLGAAFLDAPDADSEWIRPLFRLMDRFRLLTLVRDSAWGCDEINEFLELHLRPRLDGNARTPLFAGAPILITRNDSARGLFNGDVGITLRDRAGGLRVFFERQDGAVSFPAESLPAHQLGFALTVHKSQGSEYTNVMLVLPPKAGKRLLTKELIYTAITRAKTLAVICAAKDVLKFAIGRRILRESGICSPLACGGEKLK